MRRVVSFALTEKAIKKIEEISIFLGISKSAVVNMFFETVKGEPEGEEKTQSLRFYEHTTHEEQR